MSREVAFVRVYRAESWVAEVRDMCNQADLFFRRQMKSVPGDTREAMRYGLVCDDIRAVASRLDPCSAHERP
jgi:pantothenate kinase type III